MKETTIPEQNKLSLQELTEAATDELKDKYNFKEGFNLYQELLNISSEIQVYQSTEDSFSRDSIKRKKMENLQKLASTLKNSLNETPIPLRIEMSISVSERSLVLDLLPRLENLLTACTRVKASIPPKDSGGRKQETVRDNIILRLAWVYKEGTGKKLKAYTSEYVDSGYSGEFYEFLLDCAPFMIKPTNLGGTKLHLKRQIPKDLRSFRKSYILLTKSEGCLFYINNDGECIKENIHCIEKLTRKLGKKPKIILTPIEVRDLIISNGGKVYFESVLRPQAKAGLGERIKMTLSTHGHILTGKEL